MLDMLELEPATQIMEVLRRTEGCMLDDIIRECPNLT
jgi:hypothetical protein